MTGSIKLGEGLACQDLRIVMSTHPDVDLVDKYRSIGVTGSSSDFHPTALHISRRKGRELLYDEIPEPNYRMFQQELWVVNRKVMLKNNTSEYDAGRNIPESVELFPLGADNSILLGKEESMLNMLVLKNNTDARSGNDNNDHLTVRKMVQQRISEVDQKNVLSCFDGKNKDNKYKMRIKVEVYLLNADNMLAASTISCPIKNTDSKSVGALKLHDIVPRQSCSGGGRKVVMVSEFPISNDVSPRFQLWGPDGRLDTDAEDAFLKQPEQFHSVQNTIFFMTPKQPNMQSILENDLKIKLAAYRPFDDTESEAFDFQYVLCEEDQNTSYVCVFCSCNFDNVGSQNVGLVKMLEHSKPNKRRKSLPNSHGARLKQRRTPDSTSGISATLTPGPGSDSGAEMSSSPDIPDLGHDLGFNHETIEELKNITPDDVDDVLREHGIVSDSGVIVMNESLATADGPSYGDTNIKSRTTDENVENLSILGGLRALGNIFLLMVLAILLLLLVYPDIFNESGVTTASCVVLTSFFLGKLYSLRKKWRPF